MASEDPGPLSEAELDAFYNPIIARLEAAVAATRPYWRDYLCNERTMCSICRREGKGFVRVGDPIPADYQRRGRKAAFVTRQRAAFRRHVAAAHPTLKVRWAR